MVFGDWLGFVAGLLTTASFLPQVIRVLKLRSAHEISLFFNILFLVGVFIWLGYGIYFGLMPVILWNAVTTVLILALLYAKLKYGR